MISEERLFYNAVSLAMESNYKKMAKLREKKESWREVWNSLTDKDKCREINLEAEAEKLTKAGVRLIMMEDEEYPQTLREIPWPPFGIYLLGNSIEKEVEALKVSMVGTRRASEEGKVLAADMAGALARAGAVVISGLALGIDAASHKGAIESGGKSWAVVAGGLDDIYPKNHAWLAEEIIKTEGGIISEYPLSSPPLPHRFLERNRIVSGLSQATVIIEAPERSGSLATAKFAIDQNRDVYVTPGPAKSALHKGSNSLIRDGARLITGVEDLLEDLGLEEEKRDITEELTNKERLIVEAIKEEGGAANIDRLEEKTKIEVLDLQIILADLVMAGMIRENGGKYMV